MFNQYISDGIWIVKGCIDIGLVIYLTILGILWIINKRRTFKIKRAILEFMLVVYMIAVLRITGIIGMKFYFSYVFNGMYNINLIPFRDASFMMVVLNFLLFIPYGFLLPCVFKNLRFKGKIVLFIGFITSFSIEFLQLFGGRYAEIDDILVNSLGVFVGFIIFSYIFKIRSKSSEIARITK